MTNPRWIPVGAADKITGNAGSLVSSTPGHEPFIFANETYTEFCKRTWWILHAFLPSLDIPSGDCMTSRVRE
jgi:hypothetical protein